MTKVGTLLLKNAVTGEHTGSMEVRRGEQRTVRLCVNKQGIEAVMVLPPDVARALARLLLKAAGIDPPTRLRAIKGARQ